MIIVNIYGNYNNYAVYKYLGTKVKVVNYTSNLKTIIL